MMIGRRHVLLAAPAVAVIAVRETLFWAMPGYTRAATEDGARLIFGTLGFKPVPGDPQLARYDGRDVPLIGLDTTAAAAA